ncbi:family 16 glycoside hydrolase [Motilibacter deserti]|uniref:DUF1080 domain-containing protein n=1 Tax=Motilibacter deserti TaxID=2714956 RepID=A0ABX0GXX0_9ACTN|nr:DUF1080 domain-containing protein [Motilibacter deserti]
MIPRTVDRHASRGRRRAATGLLVAAVAAVSSSIVALPTAVAAVTCVSGAVCEAEQATLTGGAKTNTDHRGYTGSGFVDGVGAGASIAFGYTAATAGTHNVTIRYANAQGGDGQNTTRTMTLRVGSTDVPVSLPPSGSWDTWATVTVPVALPAGASTLDLRVATGNSGNVNIDSITIAKAPDGAVREQGVTLRIFDLGLPLQKLCTLKPGQTPNVDVLRPNVNWSTTADWAGYTANFQAQVVADLDVAQAGNYTFRVLNDDGAKVFIDGQQVIDNDGLQDSTTKDGDYTLTAGRHQLEIRYFQAGGGEKLTLSWRKPGSTTFEVVPNSVLSVEAGGARVVAPGTKECEGLSDGAGDGLPLTKVHPSFTLSNLRPAGFQPDVSGISWYPNGDAAVLTWGAAQVSTNGKLYRVSNVQNVVDPAKLAYKEVAAGLQEPQGVAVVDGDTYITSKVGLEKLVDADGDGYFEGRQRIATWPNGQNFHEFAFGLPYKDGYFYVALSVALERSGSSTVPQPGPDRGTFLKVSKDTGTIEFVAGGLRTPNGIGFGPEGEILVTDNQGGWVPASKLVQIKQGAFYNHFTTHNDESGKPQPGRFDNQPVTKPIVWMPQNEIANSPSTPVVMQEGQFAGQLAIGDVTYGGLQRVQLQKVNGQLQGALYRMTQGLEAGVNELALGPDGDLYIGGIGYDGNWNQPGKLRYGFQKLTANDTVTMDILKTEITDKGFDITYTKPLSEQTRQGLAAKYQIDQWRYNPTSQYGGPKLNQENLAATAATVSADGKTVSLTVPGVKPDRVVHIRSPRPFAAADGEALWSTEVWYTANEVPGYVAPADKGWYEAEDGQLSSGASIETEHSGYSGSGFVGGFFNNGATLTFNVNAATAGVQPVHLRYANGPNPFTGTKRVAVYVNGTKVDPWALPDTGSWKNWRTVSRDFNLQAGNNTITFKYETGVDGNVNFDALKVGAGVDICTPATEAGYTSLFDGTLESFQKWTMAGPGSFGRQDDCSILSVGGLGLLYYPQTFNSYSLKLDWKMAGDDNGGVFVGFPNPGNDPWVAVNQGFEIQIDATDDPSHTTGSIYGFQAADAAARDAVLKAPGQWNSYELIVEGQRIQVWLNGVKINDYVNTDPARLKGATMIGLQNHGTGDEVFYRNVRIKALGDTTAPTTSATVSPAAANGQNGWYVSPVTVNVTATDDAAGAVKVEYRLDGGAWTTYATPVVVAAAGEHTVDYRATDATGNVSTVKSVSFKVDAAAPTVTVTGLADGSTHGDSGTLTPSWTATDATSGLSGSVTATLDGKAIASGSTVTLYELALGEHTLVVTAKDNAGNTTTRTVTFTVGTSFADIKALIAQFNADGTISAKTVASLRDRLDKAEQAADSGSETRTISYLEQFVDRANSQVKGDDRDLMVRQLLKRDAAALIAEAQQAEAAEAAAAR